MKNKTKMLTQSATIAAIYIALTYLANALGLANGAIQLRFSEALTILPAFTPAAIPGLFIGCVLANLLTGAVVIDIVFGSIATLLGAIGTYMLKNHFGKWLSALPPILTNTLIIPYVLRLAYSIPSAIPYLALTIFIGELLSCGVLGIPLIAALKKHPGIFK